MDYMLHLPGSVKGTGLRSTSSNSSVQKILQVKLQVEQKGEVCSTKQELKSPENAE